MIKEVIAKGSTLEAARQAAVSQLAAPENVEVKIEVLAVAGRKTLGIFGGKAKVRAYYELPDAPDASATAPKTEAEKPAVKEEKAQTKPEGKVEKKASAPAEEAEPQEEIIEFKDTKTTDYLLDILSGLGIDDAKIIAKKSNGGIVFDIDCGENYGVIIGRRGETLDAIQYLVSLVANRNEGEYTRVSLNVGNYRQKREETLRSLAKRNAARVLKNGRNVVLEPMNPYERRIIHTAVQEVEGVVSHSIGSDSDRRVVITLAEGVKPTGGTNGRGYGSRGRGGYDRKGGSRRGGERRQSQPQAPAADRAPRSDVEGAFRYGKIEINKDKE